MNDEILEDLSDASESNSDVKPTEVLEEIDVKPPTPEYTKEELNELATAVQKLTTVFALNDRDWQNSNSIETIKKWLLDTNELLLTIFYDDDNLCVCLGFPLVPVYDITYLLRKTNQIFTVDNFHDEIILGTIHEDIDGSLLSVLSNVYSPIFFSSKNLAERVKSDLSSALNKFLTFLTELHFKMGGITVLYIPTEALLCDTETNTRDSELIKRLEAVAQYWVNSIWKCLKDKIQLVPHTLFCPPDEYDFWTYRFEVLRAIQQQMKHCDFENILNILKKSQSIYVKQIDDIFLTLATELEIANDNCKFLQSIVKPCKDLNLADTPLDVPPKLKRIMNIIRVIWLKSKFFNTKELISNLFQYLSNQIIIYCRNKIDIKKILNNHPRFGIKVANMSIDSCMAYKMIYNHVSEHHKNRRDKIGWNLDESVIFNHIDAFIQRLYDLIEICNAMIVFGRSDETQNIPSPLFGGTRGPEFEATCREIESRFKEGLVYIHNVSSHILDVHNIHWHDDVAKYRLLVRDLEEIVENLFSNVFMSVTNVEEGVEALCSLFNFSVRQNLRPAYIRKTSDIWHQFSEEIASTNKRLFENVHERPSWFPKYAGRAIMLKINLSRLTRLNDIFKHAEWLPENSNSLKAIDLYNTTKTNIMNTISQLNDQWLDTMHTNVAEKLNRTLMCRSVTHPGFLECNIDRGILEICEEAKFFDMIGFGVPVHVNQIYSKYNTIKLVYENVLTVVLDYNRILSALSDKERLLFKIMIQGCDRKIMPGIYKLTWGTEFIDSYIEDCVKHTRQLQEFLDTYKTANLRIVEICEIICNTPIINMTTGNVSSLIDLQNSIDTARNDTTVHHVELYNNIVNIIYIIYEGFELYIHNMMTEWLHYIEKIDNLIQEALRACAKHSLQTVYDCLHGDGTMGPSPIIEINIDLKNEKLNFTPPVKDVTDFLGSISKKVINSIKLFPRLFETFKLPNKSFTEAPYHMIIGNDKGYDRQINKIVGEINHFCQETGEYVEIWSPFKSIWELNKDEVMNKLASVETSSASTFDINILKYNEIANQVDIQETITSVYFVQINSNNLKNSINVHIKDWQDRHKELLKKNAYEKINDIFDYINSNAEQILVAPKNIEEMQKAIKFYEQLVGEVPIKETKFPHLKNHFTILDKYEMVISSGIRQMITNLDTQWLWYLNKLKEAEEMLDNSKDSFKLNLLEQAESLKHEAKQLLDSFYDLPTNVETSPKEALEKIKETRQALQFLLDKQSALINDLAVFEINIPLNLDLKKLKKELIRLEEVWSLAKKWEDAWMSYKSLSFWNIKTDEMEDFAIDLYRTLSRLSKQHRDRNWDILEKTKREVDEFRRTLPLLVSLKNPSMRSRHWNRVRNVAICKFDETDKNFNLESIVKMNFQKYTDEITDISYSATMELQIENTIKNISEIWTTMSIEMIPYRGDIYRLQKVADCFTALEDNAVQISTVKATRFVEPFAKEVDYWEKTLNYIMESLENALIVQRQWLYLENIFQDDDIRKQLPAEAQDFLNLTNEWKEITTKMFKAKNALEATHFNSPPYLLNKLLEMNKTLESIQRALEIYLDTKRQLFPRFYFISNDDLLEILGNSKKPDAVQPHMKKLFDNLKKCEINKKTIGKTVKWEAIGMYSEDGEYVKFLTAITLSGPAEKWLASIENAMHAVLKEQLLMTRKSLRKMLSKRDKWLTMWPGQLCLTSSQIQWTSDCTRSLIMCKMYQVKRPLQKLRKKQNNILAKLSEISRQDLVKQFRLKVNTLITIEIHGRDVINKMYKTNCRDVSHFEWFSQLRFYWDRGHGDCVIRQTNTKNWYGYEYTGNSGRLVITPLTDRCYITLTMALHLYRGGSPKGPAGTGKTETVKDLGKALGMWVIVSNCSESLDYKSIGKCFSGLAQTGAWGCFDEFNRINIEVLSVVAQQLLSIFSALSSQQKQFIFEGQKIRLIPTIGLFITMNPGYAGRTELPDNLKSMFRPISMIVPDNIIIVENLLFSDGFIHTKILAKKVFTLYELAKQQLSKQNHYDFGLRSMVALLRYAGNKRRQFPKNDEEQIVYLAMQDMNIAKLTSDDLPLFNGIMSDIFPGVTIPTVDYHQFLVCIKQSLTEQGLQCIASAVTKVIQLYETKKSRHSVMILGDTGTAKTTTWRTLKDAYKKMKQLGISDWVGVSEYAINPKSLSLAELYGEYNLSTGEWFDGVLSSIMRKICLDEGLDQKWLLFDGPVDAVWIENMNSVMDDNKLLTLVNSERISMPEQVSLLFEVGDLTVASPATVSRCGMVYNDYKDWGWRPYVNSWLQKQSSKTYVETLKNLFEIFLDKLFEFKRLHCNEIIASNELNLVQSLCKLLDCLATKENGIDLTSPDTETLESMTKNIFLFCMIWSVCAIVDETGRLKIDGFLREMEGIFPLKGTIYDYYVDPKHKTFMSWEDKLQDEWRYSDSLPFHKIIVPTVDTIRYNFIVKNLLTNEFPVLLVGAVGTGKTSIASSVLSEFNANKYSMLSINMSAQTTAKNLQEIIEGRTEKRTKGVYVPIGGKTMITFMDDFNMPAKDAYGSQHALELIRQWIDYEFWYDRQNQTRTHIKNMILLTAMGPPGGGRQIISNRTQSRFNVINMTFPSEATISRIFGTMIGQHLNPFNEEIKKLGKIITDATIDIYNSVVTKMLPTPAKMHYLFNLRDISKIFQGLLRCNSNYHNTKQLMLRLWIHECFRVFSDRLIDAHDQEWFLDEVNNQLGKHFELTFHNLCPSKESPIFGDFVSATYYEDLNNTEILRNFLIGQLNEFNQLSGLVKMNLVLFKDAIEHITRIVRVISQPCGHMLLIGVGGSGRQSLSRIAAYVIDSSTYQVEVTRKYKTAEFREDLKTLYLLVGVENRSKVFIFNDTQVAEENFLEILNNMLSVGEVPNLYKPEEFEEIKNALESEAIKAKIIMTTEAIFEFFMERAKSNLHIIFCMSPIGNSFRDRLRQYPGLVNSTTIDWFHEWPQQALLEVAHRFLTDCKLNVAISDKSEKSQKRRESLIQTTEAKMHDAVASMFALIHTSVAEMSNTMLADMKRHNYVTPTNYLILVSGFQLLLERKRNEISLYANRLRNGLFKVEDTKEKVIIMSEELKISQQQVKEYQAECEQFILKIEEETKKAEIQKQNVSEQSQLIELEESDIKTKADLAQKDLDKAMPALDAATKALDALNKKDLTEVRSYVQPPTTVEKVMEVVMILLKRPTTWVESKRMLGEHNFLDQLKNFDKDNINDKIMKRIAKYTTDPSLVPEKVGIVSFACKSLIMWVRAIERYSKIYKIVGPKIMDVKQLKESLLTKQQQLADAKNALEELNKQLEELRESFEKKTLMKEQLQQRAETLKRNLERAFMLVDGLSEERIRWIKTVEQLDIDFLCLPGDCLISIAFISYLGPFISLYRTKLVKLWCQNVEINKIPISHNFLIWIFLCDPTTIREWTIQGLPSDDFSTENGIIVTNGSRWPLIIDPQSQALKWIKNMEKSNKLLVIDFGQPSFITTLEEALQFGKPVLLQNVAEQLDPILMPILNKDIVKIGGSDYIKFNDKTISYNQEFRLFITTKLSNPHYSPEISTKTTIVNFAVKEKGLEDQLLGIVVRKEKPTLEEEKDQLIVSIAKNRKTLVTLENEILRMLNESRGSLLDDDELFSTLQTSKETSAEVTESLTNSVVTEIEIDTAREEYRPCAKRAAILFFVLMSMSQIDPMYQFSLDTYIDLFVLSIERSSKKSDIVERIDSLNTYQTYAVYNNTCRGLFEMHKILFSFYMCTKILEADHQMNMTELIFLLKGGIVLDRNEQVENPCKDWISDTNWDNLTELDKLPGFHGIVDSFEHNAKVWHEWYATTEPEIKILPCDWETTCNQFQKMLVVRCLRADRITSCVRTFIIDFLGKKFVEPPVLDIKSVLAESSPKTPLIFVLSTGVDPSGSLIQLAESKNMASRFYSLSLGQGQAPIATKMISEGIKYGHWVFLANCHLSLSWMPELDKIVDTLQYEQTNRKFRLWLSSNPTPEFPISILQAGIKMTTEPPKGIKANLKRMYHIITEEKFKICETKEKYKKLLFSLCYFHSILLERKKFQQLGWNIVYSFNDSDFDVSEHLLSIYLDEYPETPWDALKYLIAGVNYGGHVTDDWDRRLLTTYINQFYCEEALTVTNYKLSSLSTYYIPRDGNLDSYRNYIQLLPNIDKPEAFGQHSNADIATLITETKLLFETLLSIQTEIKSTDKDELNAEDIVYQISEDILSKIPNSIDYENTSKLIGSNKMPLDVILLQEIERFNVLLTTIKSNVINLQKGIKGLVVMNSELENICLAMVEGRVPTAWLEAYSSLKPLGSWTRDLILRIEHFSKWAETTHAPVIFWLSAFTFPNGFLTAILQTVAREKKIPIDMLDWEFNVSQLDDSLLIEPPHQGGVYIRGLYLEGAGWNARELCLQESKPMELVCKMPTIHFHPIEPSRRKLKGLYECPVYYYPIRNNSYVLAVGLKCGFENSDFWIKRGTALLLSLAN